VHYEGVSRERTEENQMSTATATLTYRKTGKDEWVAFGPVSAMRTGTVTITKRDGTTKTEYVERVGKTFQANGTDCCYGYLAKTVSAPRAKTVSAPRAGAGRYRYETRSCEACEWNQDCGDMQGCADHRGNPRT
jgi:hypothetical protein